MQTISLPLSVTSNRALNADLTTALRTLNLVQSETYTVNLAFYSGATLYSPAIDEFAFRVRNDAGADILSVTSATSGATGWSFQLPLTSPILTNAIGTRDRVDFKGVLSWTEDAELDVIEPFTVRIAAATTGAAETGYVASLNGLEGDVTITGAGGVTITNNGNTITVSGGAGDTSALEAEIDALQAATGSYATTAAVVALDTGNVKLTGTQTITGTKIFAGTVLLNNTVYGTSAVGGMKLSDSTLRNNIGGSAVALDWSNKILSGDWQTNTAPTIGTHVVNKSYFDTQTGSFTTLFYPRASNPSGYLTTIPSDVVRTTGNQTINGAKTFADTASFSNSIFVGDILANVSPDYGISLNNAQLIGTYTTATLDWSTRITYDSTAVTSLNWDIRQLVNDTSHVTVNWNYRYLYNSYDTVTLDWENGQLNGYWAINTEPIFDGGLVNKGYLDTRLAGATPSGVVYQTGNQTVSGRKTFAAQVSQEAAAPAEINWLSGNLFYKVLTGNQTFTFTGDTNGQTINVVTTATGGYTVAWPTGVKWANGVAYSGTSGTALTGVTDVWQFIKVNGNIYGNVGPNFR